MNYFSHAIRFLDQPLFVAGTAIPDWLRILDRVRASSKSTTRFLEDAGAGLSLAQQEICQGILQHHSDDDRFHNNPAFLALNWQMASELRSCLESTAIDTEELNGMRVHFVAHITIELLLDSGLVERFPSRLQKYYQIVDQLNGEWIASTLASVVRKPVPKLATLIRRFGAERFIYDYVDDARLLKRINQVMKRVNLAPLPVEAIDWLRASRKIVDQQSGELLDFAPSL